VLLLPTFSGYVLLRDISYCYGDKTMLVSPAVGHAISILLSFGRTT